jgi:leucyl aminopeptidase
MLAPGQITYLPVDLGRWDRSPGGDVLVVPLWSDVRPLRGVAGLLDWRLNGRLSQMLREEKLQGESGEKMLFFTERVPWKRILAVGLGATEAFNEQALKKGFRSAFDSFRGLGIKSVAMALPGRDMDRITPERAMRILAALMGSHEEQNPLAAIEALTIIDVPLAIKAMTDTVKALEKAVVADIEITWSDEDEQTE